MSDEEIAKRCGLKVSDVRAVLNKLHEYGITTYLRERDKETGWFSYNWTINLIKLYDMLEKKKENGARRDSEALTYEKSYTFYTCGNLACSGAGQRIPESDAIVTTYACNRCGEHLKIYDNTGIIKSIEEKLASRVLPDDQTFVKEFRHSAKPGKSHAKPPAHKFGSAKKRPIKSKSEKPARKLKKTAKKRKR